MCLLISVYVYICTRIILPVCEIVCTTCVHAYSHDLLIIYLVWFGRSVDWLVGLPAK